MFSSNTSQVSEDANYIESCFSTYLYTGNGSTQTITNGIDLAGKGGLVWLKSRSTANSSHVLIDSARGSRQILSSNTTANQVTAAVSEGITAFNANGFSLGTNVSSDIPTNTSAATYASWTFRKQPKFFDVVTFTTNASGVGSFSHSLGAVPGMVVFKRTDDTEGWFVYHRSLNTTSNYLMLNSTNGQGNIGGAWYSATTTTVTAGLSAGTPFAANGTYVAYLFAHDAGGFGLTGTDNVISCGSFTTDGSGNATVNLGYEPQWVLYKPSTAVNNWKIFDNMRGMVVGNGDKALYPNTSGAEVQDDSIQPSATGFSIVGGDASATHIYIAIRRGPMKTPTSGTSVFAATKVDQVLTTDYTHTDGFNPDLVTFCRQDNRVAPFLNGCNFIDRLRGNGKLLACNSTAADATDVWVGFDVQKAHKMLYGSPLINSSATSSYVSHAFRRAPGFFDEVCYTGTGAARTVAHNLAAAPEMMIVKKRSSATASDWYVYHSGMVDLTYPNPATQYIRLNLTNNWVRGSSGAWNNTQPTSSVFSLGDTSATNASGQTFVAYLFATLAGVSKVGSYTGTGTTQQINCGFTSGARFIMVKSTSTTGDWIVVDTARGLVSGNDPTLALNSTAAEVTTNDWFDPYSAGFELSSVSGNLANTNGTSYIYLAIA